MVAGNQKILPFGDVQKDYSLENFIVSDSNYEVFSCINNWADWSNNFLLIYGDKSSGKTHLANIFYQLAGDKVKIIEDIDDKISSDEAFETELFHLYNQVRNSKDSYLLLTSSKPAQLIDFKLPDLKSRINSVNSIKIDLPDDELMKMILIKSFSDRQLRVNSDVIGYIIDRVERSFDAIENLVAEIDNLSIQEKRNITIPFVRKLF